MIRRLHQFRRWAGVDRAVFFSNAAQLVRLVTGPVTMALVLKFLTPEIQGYYYAFAGVVAFLGLRPGLQEPAHLDAAGAVAE